MHKRAGLIFFLAVVVVVLLVAVVFRLKEKQGEGVSFRQIGQIDRNDKDIGHGYLHWYEKKVPGFWQNNSNKKEGLAWRISNISKLLIKK